MIEPSQVTSIPVESNSAESSQEVESSTADDASYDESYDGFFGEMMRFTCCTHDFTTKIRGGATYVVGAYYQESGNNEFHVTSGAVKSSFRNADGHSTVRCKQC